MNPPAFFHRPPGPRIAYAIAGKGPLLVLLHGVGGNRYNWTDQMDAFADRYTVVAWDARGYGDSSDTPPLQVFSDFGDDLAALIGHLGHDTAHLVGLSMGGMIALDLVTRRPNLVASLTLADTTPGFGPSEATERAEFLARRLTPLQNGARLRDIADDMAPVLVSKTAGNAVRAAVLDSLHRLREQPYMRALQALTIVDLSASLDKVNVPTLVIVGEHDIVTPPQKSEQLADAISGAELVKIPDCGHLSNIEKPDEFNRHLAEFLQSLHQ